jgi:hypothetical protein
MASPFVSQLVSGILNPKGNVADFRHASRLFVDNEFRLAPKSKFNFHVVFNINTQALKSLNFTFRHRNEINMLVKKCELPKFTIDVETLNQYNRKKVVQTKVNYTPVQITFHDDRLGVTRQLWENYFSYYYADPTTSKSPGTYHRTAMTNSSFAKRPYGFDNNSSIPFFDNITIYQMANHQYASYTLVNPIITAWNHDSLDQSAGNQPAEQSMTLAYEAVNYGTGIVDTASGNPPGFGQDHYDTVPSPLTLAGGGTKTIFGSGGVLSGIESVAQRIADGTAFESSGNFVTTAIQAINTYNNAKGLNKSSVNNELYNIALNGINSLGRQGVSGIQNTSFPINNTNQQQVIAQPRQL